VRVAKAGFRRDRLRDLRRPRCGLCFSPSLAVRPTRLNGVSTGFPMLSSWTWFSVVGWNRSNAFVPLRQS
jgi:hypothetical protein